VFFPTGGRSAARDVTPGEPIENGLVEHIRQRFRDECLNATIFKYIGDGKKKIRATATS
jgi:hypothetical protein